jgi:hypothetical protein
MVVCLTQIVLLCVAFYNSHLFYLSYSSERSNVGAKRYSTPLIRDLSIDSESWEDAVVRAEDVEVVDAAIVVDAPRVVGVVVARRTEPPTRTAGRSIYINPHCFSVIRRLSNS